MTGNDDEQLQAMGQQQRDAEYDKPAWAHLNWRNLPHPEDMQAEGRLVGEFRIIQDWYHHISEQNTIDIEDGQDVPSVMHQMEMELESWLDNAQDYLPDDAMNTPEPDALAAGDTGRAITVRDTPQPLDINEITEQWLFGDSPTEAAPHPDALAAALAERDAENAQLKAALKEIYALMHVEPKDYASALGKATALAFIALEGIQS